MAKNIEINIKESTGNYETLYPQTIASQIASGVLADARIPSLSTSKITSGTFDTARIPNLSANKITEGTFGGLLTGEYIFPGNLRIGGSSSSSNAKIRIGDGDYVYFHEDTDDNLTIKAKRIEFTTTSSPGLTNNGVALGGGGGVTLKTVTWNGTGGTSWKTINIPTVSGKTLFMLNIGVTSNFTGSTQEMAFYCQARFMLNNDSNVTTFFYLGGTGNVATTIDTYISMSSGYFEVRNNTYSNKERGFNVSNVTYIAYLFYQ